MVGGTEVSEAQDFYDAVKRQYDALREEAADEGEVAVMRYHTPAGREIKVGTLRLVPGENTITIFGEDDHATPHIIVVSAQNAHVILQLVPEDKASPSDRRPIGFT
jgi:hypothetical protein